MKMLIGSKGTIVKLAGQYKKTLALCSFAPSQIFDIPTESVGRKASLYHHDTVPLVLKQNNLNMRQ